MPRINTQAKEGPTSFRPDAIMAKQLAELSAMGFGDTSAVLRRAVDRMWREEQVLAENERLRRENADLRRQLLALEEGRTAAPPDTE
jgi:hypothetical protein